MSLDDYKLSCELYGHSLDVRSVCEGKEESIVSGSRDKSAKIWNSEGGTYVEGLTLRDHKNFISCVCVLENGALICTGSNDATICVYTVGNAVPLATLKGHTNTVCALAPGLDPNTLISSSWDKTARLWTIAGFGPSASVAFVGHEAAVWAVATIPSKGQYVTGSADKNIFFWNKNGEQLKVLKGHTDCVRGLIGMSNGGLISCGNDAIIKYWSDDGDCIREFHGHSNYIYSIAMNTFLGEDCFVTGGEDSTLRMWSLASGALGEAIVLPAQSVWSVACLSNGDIVTGTSDAVVRVFTKDPSRVAPEQIQDNYNVAVGARVLKSKDELGGIKVNDLPGPESLLQDGREGQTKIVRHADGKVMCYQWTKNEWICLGDVTGASGGSQENSGKTLYEGKEYDFVFNVDISDTGLPLKLPYNIVEEPWLVAQKFIHKHDLPQVYLEQVANFIIKNSNRVASASEAASSGGGFQDPFTGGGRYIPGSASARPFGGAGGGGGGAVGDMVDPFTGSSSYRSAEAQQQATPSVQKPPPPLSSRISSSKTKHFPLSQYIIFSAGDSTKVLNKLKEFNNKLDDITLKTSDSSLEQIIKFALPEPAGNLTHLDAFRQLLNWPKDLLFPVLDIARLAVRDQTVCSKLVTSDFLNIIIRNLSAEVPAANQLMALRCITNMMNHGFGRGSVESRLNEIITNISGVRTGSGNLQIAIASLLLNTTITQLQLAEQQMCHTLTAALLEFLEWSTELEAFYRAYQALGNLTCTPYGQITSAQIISVYSVVDKMRDNMYTVHPSGFEKLKDVSQELIDAL